MLFYSRGGVDNLLCSGRGTCNCSCSCNQPSDPNKMIFGDACECDNFRCPLNGNGLVCSGKKFVKRIKKVVANSLFCT